MRTLLVILLAAACTKTASPDKAKPATADKPAVATAKTAATANQLGTPISATTPVVALADVLKDPAAYKNKPFVTTGTVTAVCQEMGCWMEIKDGTTEAHIKMAGEKFSIPKDSSGHKARVQGTLATSDGDGDADSDCAAGSDKQPAGQVAKLQLEATGVELD